MNNKSREDLVGIVQKLIDADLPEEEEDCLLGELKEGVLHPRVSDLIFHPNPSLTAEEVVDQALAYHPTEQLFQPGLSVLAGPDQQPHERKFKMLQYRSHDPDGRLTRL